MTRSAGSFDKSTDLIFKVLLGLALAYAFVRALIAQFSGDTVEAVAYGMTTVIAVLFITGHKQAAVIITIIVSAPLVAINLIAGYPLQWSTLVTLVISIVLLIYWRRQDKSKASATDLQ